MSILRMPAVRGKTGHACAASIYNQVNAGLFTKPVKIGQRSVGWPACEVDAIIAARIASKTNDEIKELVNRLHEERKQVGFA